MGLCKDCGAEIESGEYCESCMLLRDLGLDNMQAEGDEDFLSSINDLLPEDSVTLALDDSNVAQNMEEENDMLDFMNDLNIDEEFLNNGGNPSLEEDILSLDEMSEEPKRNSQGTDVGDILSDALGVLNDTKMDQLEEEYMSLIPDVDPMEEKAKKEKKKGFFARLFGNVPLDKDEMEEEPTEEELKAIKEEKEKKKAEQKALKAQKKKEKADAKEKAKKDKLAAKEAKKKEKLEAQVPEEPSRINRVGAGIIFGLFAAIACVVIFGTNTFTYAQSVSNAKDYFSKKRYTRAYMQLAGLEIKEKDQKTYDRVVTVMYVNKQLNSYENYYNMEKYPEALDSLVKGLKRYNKYLEQAKELDIKQDLDYVKAGILDSLNESFGLEEGDVAYLLSMHDQEKYSQEIVRLSQEN